MVEYLPDMCKALDLISSTAKKRERRGQAFAKLVRLLETDIPLTFLHHEKSDNPEPLELSRHYPSLSGPGLLRYVWSLMLLQLPWPCPFSFLCVVGLPWLSSYHLLPVQQISSLSSSYVCLEVPLQGWGAALGQPEQALGWIHHVEAGLGTHLEQVVANEIHPVCVKGTEVVTERGRSFKTPES